MNIHTFSDAVSSRRGALADEVEDDDDDEGEVRVSKRAVDGEEEEGAEKFNDAGDPIEPFNMKNEREGGFIDDNMNYVFQKEDGEVDAWVAGLDEAALEQAIGEAALAEKKRIAKLEVDERRRTSGDLMRKSPLELKYELLSLMQPGETLSTTLRRLSGREDKSRSDSGIRRRKQPNSSSDSMPTKRLSAVEKNRLARKNHGNIERVTEVADRLIAAGLTGLYSMSYEAIYASTVLWEYKGHDAVIHGPFTSQQISGWKAQGYLTGSTAVSIRQVGRPTLSSANASAISEGTKPVRFESKKEISIYDDDEIDSSSAQQTQSTVLENHGAAKLMEIAVGQQPLTANVVEINAQAQAADEGWLNSDDIDFGEYIDLNHDRMEANRSSINKISVQLQQNYNVANAKDVMDDDEDDGDEEVEVGKLQSRRKRKYNADADSDGENEDD